LLVYVLDKRLQDGDSLPKWKSRSWLGVYIGPSLVHAGNVPVVYNPITTHISPQFHVVFDDQFSSVGWASISLPASFYEKLFATASWEYQTIVPSDPKDLYTFESFWSPPASVASKKPR
jgi:hypothetical protein